MHRKTRIDAGDGKQELTINREFELPVELLFRAHVEPAIVEQWMGTKVLKLENKRHGGWQFVTTDPMGNAHGFHGVIHEIVPNRKITRTFEMENTAFGVQLEFLEFEELTADASRLRMQIVYRSVAARDEMLKLPFAQGINAAHDRLQEIAGRIETKRTTNAANFTD